METEVHPGKRTAGEARADAAAKRKDVVVTASMARAILRRDGAELHADFPNQNGDRSKGPVRISFLLRLDPEVAAAIAEGYTMHCLKNVRSADRRRDIAGNLNRGLMSYLERPIAESPDLKQPDSVQPGPKRTKLGDIDERFLHRFKAWLDKEDREGFLANQVSRSELLSALQLSLAQLMKSREWQSKLSPKLRLIAKPYPKMSRDIEHTAPLGEPEYERLYTGIAADIGATVGLREAQMDAMDELDGGLLTLEEAGLSPVACAAWLDAHHEHPVPSYYDLSRTDAAYVRNVPAAVHAEAEHILYPNLDEIVPMVLVVTAFFALNPSTAYKLRKGGIDYKISQLGDVRRLRMYPNKKRASLRQRNVLTVTKHPDNPGRVLEYLERRTERLGRARPEIASRAFARFSFEARRAVGLNTSDEAWKQALKRFADRHKLPEFTLDQLRPTTLDLVHELSGGNIIAMQGVATHTNAQTTYTYYTSEAQRLRNRKKLGELLMQMQRYALKDGKIRPEDLPPGVAAHAAATPGFSCIDPKDSPIDGQVRGELCAAYGRCPECPLAVVDPTSPRSLAYLMMLNKRITEASERLPDPVAFHMRWAPVQTELLTYWMRGWPKEIVEQARQIPIPELPAVE